MIFNTNETMIVKLTYLHEHLCEEDIPEHIWWDEELDSYCIHDDAENFRDVFHLQFQIGGWAKRNGVWFAQVGYGYPNERVILERKNKQQLHVILKHLVFEDDERQLWSFERVRTKDFYKPAPPAPAEPDELSAAVAGMSVSGAAADDDSDAEAAASRS